MRKKKLKKECWNVDYELIKWVNEHFKVYKEDTTEMVDLEFYKFIYKGEEYTQLQLIDKIIHITNYLLENYYNCFDEEESKKLVKMTNEMYDILKKIHFAMWW